MPTAPPPHQNLRTGPPRHDTGRLPATVVATVHLRGTDLDGVRADTVIATILRLNLPDEVATGCDGDIERPCCVRAGGPVARAPLSAPAGFRCGSVLIWLPQPTTVTRGRRTDA